MKDFGFTASVLNGSNRVFSLSESNWSAILPNSLIKFGGEDVFYTVARVEPIFYIKDFSVISSGKIKIQDNVGINLVRGDSIFISFKEWETKNIIKLLDGGQNYKMGDEIYCEGGEPTYDSQDNVMQIACFVVLDVDGAGKILNLAVKYPGKYATPPADEMNLTGGSGTGARVRVMFGVSDTRTTFDRTVEMIELGAESIVYLNHPLPPYITNGKLSVEKWCLYLTANYAGDNKINAEYKILRDFTPLGFALAAKNTPSLDSLFNDALQKIDAELRKIHEKLKD